MKRTSIKGEGPRKKARPETEPNFYQMPPLQKASQGYINEDSYSSRSRYVDLQTENATALQVPQDVESGPIVIKQQEPIADTMTMPNDGPAHVTINQEGSLSDFLDSLLEMSKTMLSGRAPEMPQDFPDDISELTVDLECCSHESSNYNHEWPNVQDVTDQLLVAPQNSITTEPEEPEDLPSSCILDYLIKNKTMSDCKNTNPGQTGVMVRNTHATQHLSFPEGTATQPLNNFLPNNSGDAGSFFFDADITSKNEWCTNDVFGSL